MTGGANQAMAQQKPDRVLRVTSAKGQSVPEALAQNAFDPSTNGLFAALSWTDKTIGQTGVNEALGVVTTYAEQAAAGDLSAAKRMLMAESIALNAMFTEMSRKAADCLVVDGEKGTWQIKGASAMQICMNVALKAQSQCRTTLEALNELVNPRSVAFIKQANLANGPQQINNGNGVAPPAAPARGETQNAPNTLLQENPSERLDTRAPQAAGRVDQELATVGAVHGAQDAGGEARRGAKRYQARAA